MAAVWGYASIKSLATRFENHNVVVSKDWQSEDFSPCGRGTSQRQVEKAVDYAALRYNRDLHVSNAKMDEALDLFALRLSRANIEKELKQIESDALTYHFDFSDILQGYQKGYYEDLLEKLYDWRNEHEEKRIYFFHSKIL